MTQCILQVFTLTGSSLSSGYLQPKNSFSFWAVTSDFHDTLSFCNQPMVTLLGTISLIFFLVEIGRRLYNPMGYVISLKAMEETLIRDMFVSDSPIGPYRFFTSCLVQPPKRCSPRHPWLEKAPPI